MGAVCLQISFITTISGLIDILTVLPRQRGGPVNTFAYQRNRKLINENGRRAVKSVTASAFKSYTDGTFGSINRLAELKGIGISRAFLLLSTLHPETIPFLSKEVCEWVFQNHQSGARELKDFFIAVYSAARTAIWRLGVSAMDLDKVAFVLGRESRVSSKPN